jgi:hypothetical protein
MKPLARLTISALSPPLPEPQPTSLVKRIERLRALLNRSDELRSKPDPLDQLRRELERMERLLQD